MSELFDTSKQDKIKLKSDKKRERQLNDIRKVLSSAEGRRFFWRILGHAGLYRNSNTGNSQTFFNEGKRSEALFWLDELMEADHKAFAIMQSENYSEAKSEQIQLEKEKENE